MGIRVVNLCEIYARYELEGGGLSLFRGGSFNPLTLARDRLIEVALDARGAKIGIFVPVSDAYRKSKMRS